MVFHIMTLEKNISEDSLEIPQSCSTALTLHREQNGGITNYYYYYYYYWRWWRTRNTAKKKASPNIWLQLLYLGL